MGFSIRIRGSEVASYAPPSPDPCTHRNSDSDPIPAGRKISIWIRDIEIASDATPSTDPRTHWNGDADPDPAGRILWIRDSEIAIDGPPSLDPKHTGMEMQIRIQQVE